MDSDGQFDPIDIKGFVTEMEKADVDGVVGCRAAFFPAPRVVCWLESVVVSSPHACTANAAPPGHLRALF